MQPEIRQKLMELTTRERRVHSHPWVLRPTGLAPFSEEELLVSGQTGRRILELGSGWGEFCIGWLETYPDDCYVALEIKADRIARLLSKARRLGQVRLRVLPVNFNWFLPEFFPPQCFDRIIVNFPDPWPKRRHWKHRTVNAGFPDRIENLLRASGTVHIATDYGPYARKILRIFRNSKKFRPALDPPHYTRTRPQGLPPTRFEQIHLELGHVPYYQTWQVAR